MCSCQSSNYERTLAGPIARRAAALPSRSRAPPVVGLIRRVLHAPGAGARACRHHALLVGREAAIGAAAQRAIVLGAPGAVGLGGSRWRIKREKRENEQTGNCRLHDQLQTVTGASDGGLMPRYRECSLRGPAPASPAWAFSSLWSGDEDEMATAFDCAKDFSQGHSHERLSRFGLQ